MVALFNSLVQTLFPGGKVLQAWTLQGGMSAGMIALEIALREGGTRRVILRQPAIETRKRNPNAAMNEFRLLKLMHARGFPVPEPLFLDAAGVYLPAPGLVLGYIEGEHAFTLSDPTGSACRMAAHLACIHKLVLPAEEIPFLAEKQSCAEYERAQSENGSNALPVEQIRETLKIVKKPPSLQALLHGDFWPGNILWQDGGIAAVIDWEDACLGDPLNDLSISRLDIAWIFGWEVMQVFTRHYFELMQINEAGLPYWDLCAALRLSRLVGDDLAGWATYFLPYGREDITPEKIRACYLDFVGRAIQKCNS